MSRLNPPQMVTNSRMLYFTWVPADPAAVRALVPASLEVAENAQCFINPVSYTHLTLPTSDLV